MGDELESTLRRHGHRVTRPRRAVWDALHRSEGHATVDELSTLVEASHPGVNIASVYRALSLFEDLDLARESRLGDDEAGRWELAHPDEHFHLVCDTCGEISHHVGDLVEQIEDHLLDGHGFAVGTVELTVTGRCRDCQQGRGRPRPSGVGTGATTPG